WRNGDGTDTFNGGAGTDTQQLIMSDADGDIATLTATGANAVFARTNLVPFTVTMTAAEVVDFQGQGGDDSFTVSDLTGTTITQVLFSGGVGNDTLAGLATATPITANGGDGNDSLTGGTGADTLNGDAGNDTLEGHRGADTITGGDGDDLNIWRNGDGTDTFNGGAGTDTQQLIMSDADGDIATLTATGANAVFARTNLVPFTVTMTAAEVVDFQGQGGDDSFTVSDLTGTTITQVLFSGGVGNDTLNAGAATTTISADGGIDNDFIFTGSADDVIAGGAGLDKLFGGGGNDLIFDDTGASSEINGEAGNDTITGGSGNDYITGGEGNDIIVGGTDGQDSLFGSAGDDYIVAADADNNGIGSVLDGGAGANQLYALVGVGNDYAVGGEGADIIATGAGSDFIFGIGGNDTIVAGTGTDYIYGGAGNDFIYTDDLITNSTDYVYVSGLSGFGTGIDTVADFTFGAGGDVAVILSTPGLTSFADVQANMIDADVYTVINLSASDQLFLYNIDPFQLTADNFLFL
ncbi:MAG: calcium-binding protein, partial [Alphaproteobacteria bacterium]